MSALLKPENVPFVEDASTFAVFVFCFSANALPVRANEDTINVAIIVFIMLSPELNFCFCLADNINLGTGAITYNSNITMIITPLNNASVNSLLRPLSV